MSWCAPNAWLRCFARNPAARARCYLLPHAGGGASFYRHWAQVCSSDLELWVVQYPGREDRTREPLLPRMSQLVDRMVEGLLPQLDMPFVLLGHSMGAAVAFELTKRLERVARPPRLLVASSLMPPTRLYRRCLHLGSDADLWQELVHNGGTRAEVAAEPTIRDFFTPALRNDYRLIETYLPSSGLPLHTPICALYGEQDDQIEAADMAAWQQHTRAPLHLRSFAGGHFYIVPHREAVLTQVSQLLACAPAFAAQ